MKLFWIVSVLIATAAASDDDEIIDLQELLRNVERSYREFGLNVQNLIRDNANNANLINANVRSILDNVDANARRAEATASANARRIEQNFLEFKSLFSGVSQSLSNLSTVIGDTCCSGPGPKATGADCAEIFSKGEKTNGVYTLITPSGNVEAYCDMKTDGGGWTVFQRRGDFGFPKDYFYRDWTSYKVGFGDLDKEFWMGNDRISALTQRQAMQLRVDLWDSAGNQVYAKYSTFRLENEAQQYVLRVEGYFGTAGDAMNHHNKIPFSTKDRDNDPIKQNCAVMYEGAWWYYGCHNANLNGLNLRGSVDHKGITWVSWKNVHESLAFVEMKMRPVNFRP